MHMLLVLGKEESYTSRETASVHIDHPCCCGEEGRQSQAQMSCRPDFGKAKKVVTAQEIIIENLQLQLPDSATHRYADLFVPHRIKCRLLDLSLERLCHGGTLKLQNHVRV